MSTKYPGVYVDKLKNGKSNYRASLTYKTKHISLGSYKTASKASKAYEDGLKILSGKYELNEYSDKLNISFDKFISLINLRDNNIYFSTPIYLRKSYFSYFVSPTVECKFDMDDLFYFTSHKIMKRGEHLFVADFGLQESVNSRFGIRPYAVRGRDYKFVNEDLYDFRRENIEIINPYIGVLKRQKKNQTFYEVKIHVNGNLAVGRYDSESVAAIAYNKAADILNKNGMDKEYLQNFIDDLSPSEYAKIYSEVEISNSIYEYKSGRN